jgi:type II secretory pathway component GspD/PulD (secretin)
MKTFAALLLAFAIALPASAREALISIDVRNADIVDVLSLLSSQSGTNIVPDSSIKPERITLHLHAVTFDRALSVLVEAHDLQVRREGAVLIVGTSDSMNRRFGEANDPRSASTAVLSLAHAVPEDIAKEIASGLPEGTVILADKRTRSLIVTGSSQTLERARTLVSAFDAPAYGSRNAGDLAHSYGLRYLRPSEVVKQLKEILPDGTYIADDLQNAVVVTGNDETQQTAAQFLRSIDVPSPQVMFEVRVADVEPVNEQSNVGVTFGGYDLGGQPSGGSASYAFARNSLSINATLSALVSQGRAQILATPKLVTLNNKEADLLIGQTYPVVYYDARMGGQQVQFVDIGVKLRLTPTIGPDGSVTAEMHPEYSAIQGFVGGYPVLANRKVDSTLRVRDNETIVLGGLLREADSETITKIPGLSDVPILGKFFQNKARTRERDEIVFLITPHVIPAGAAVPSH